MFNDTILANSEFMASIDQLKLSEKIINIFIAIFIILANASVLIATWEERSLHQPNKYFVACLAVADLLVGLFAIPLRVHEINQEEKGGKLSVHLDRLKLWIEYFSYAVSVTTLTFISFDRYLKISKPLQYKSRMTTSRSLKIIFGIFILAIAGATFITTPHSASDETLLNINDLTTFKRLMIVMIVVGFFVPTTIMLVMYSLIFSVSRKRQKMLRSGGLGQAFNVHSQRNALRQDLKVIKMLLFVVGVYIFCWCTTYIWLFLLFYYPNFNHSDNRSLNYWLRLRIIGTAINILRNSNSLCNPIIYACFDRTYRKAFKHLFQRMMCWQD